jgi:hypothetical protein
MKSKEMFEELGYEYINETKSEVIPHIEYKDNFNEKQYFFNIVNKTLECYRENKYGNATVDDVDITPQEHQAIHQQMKELGWIK